MTVSLAHNPSAPQPVMIAANRLAKDVTPDRMVQMLDELGVEDSNSVVEAATRIVGEARDEFNRAWSAAARKATSLMIAGISLIVVGVTLLVSTEANQGLAQLVFLAGAFLTFRSIKRRDQLARQSFRNTVRFT